MDPGPDGGSPPSRPPPPKKTSMIKVAYNNVQQSDAYADSIHETCKDHDIIFIAKPHIFHHYPDISGTAQHPNFHILNPSLHKDCKLLTYVNKHLGAHLTYLIRVYCKQVFTGACRITGIYAPPHPSPHQLRDLLNCIKPHTRSCILGDFNTHYEQWGHKTNTRGSEVAAWGDQRALTQHPSPNTTTWRRGNKTSTLDLIFVSQTLQFHPTPHHLSFLASDHCLLSIGVFTSRPNTYTYKVTDWEFFTNYAEDPPPYNATIYGQAYSDLQNLLVAHQKTKRSSSHSKRWWDQEVDQQLHPCRAEANSQDHKTQKKILNKLIKNKKRACWRKFLQENGHRDPWNVVWIAKDPLHTKARLHTLTDGNKELSSPQEILQAFRNQHLLKDEYPATTPSPPVGLPQRAYLPASLSTVRNIQIALSRTSNNSAPGPDRISYRLLKILQDTPLGEAVLNDIAYNTDHPSQDKPPWAGMNMVMIPKPNKDHNSVKGWRPIVLSNTSSLLEEKVIADRLQKAHGGFHGLQYGSRKRRSAIDAMSISISRITRDLNLGSRVSLMGKDIVSAFPHLRSGSTLDRLQACSPENLAFVRQFLTPHHL